MNGNMSRHDCARTAEFSATGAAAAGGVLELAAAVVVGCVADHEDTLAGVLSSSVLEHPATAAAAAHKISSPAKVLVIPATVTNCARPR